jgi:hypothetical protein
MFSYIEKNIKDGGNYAIILNNTSLEELWNWCVNKYNPINVLSDFNSWTKHISDNKVILLVVINYERSSLNINRLQMGANSGISNNLLFLRNNSEYKNYKDWDLYKVINLIQIQREEKLNEIIK